MAENMQELKRRMKSIESTEHITNAMRLVSASKYKKAKNIFDKTNEQLSEVSATIEKIIAGASAGMAEAAESAESGIFLGKAGTSPAGKDSEKDGKTILIAVTSNRGLCGGFNANINRQAIACAEGIPKEKLEVFAVGSKGRDFFEHNGYTILGEYLESPEKVTFADTKKIAKPILEKCRSGEAAQVLLVYTQYVNSLKQEPVVKKLMPLDTEGFSGANEEIEFFPQPKEVLEYMIPKYFELTLFKAIIESAACEHAARRTAMESATDNANEILAKLSLTYNRVRQAAITNEIIEIVSGAESQK